MSLRDIFKIIKDTATQIPNIHSFYEGNIYELNENQSVDYSSIVVTQDQHTVDMDLESITYNLYIFYVDRENNDSSNVVDVQSAGITRLNTIIDALADAGLIVNNYTIDVFRERFSSLCAGAYAHVGLSTLIDTCNDYEVTTSTTTIPPTTTTTTTVPPQYKYVDYGTVDGLNFDNKWSAEKWGDADRLESIPHGVYPKFFRLGFSSNPQTVPMAAAVDDPFNPNLKYLAIGRPVNTTIEDFETCATPSTISYYAFQNVSGLEAIFIGESVETVDYRAFTCSPTLDDDERFDHINRIVLFGSHAPALTDSRGQGRLKLSGLAQEGVLEYKNDVMSNLEAWINAIPSGWEVKKT